MNVRQLLLCPRGEFLAKDFYVVPDIDWEGRVEQDGVDVLCQGIGQGELVGRVGQTGLATGPHLHYGLKKGGRYVNPILEHRNMPPGDPVPAVLLNVFSSERDRYMSLLLAPSATRAADNN